MALRIHFAHPAGSELKRILLELLGSMTLQLELSRDEPAAEFVHEARKTSKKICAILRLTSCSVAPRQRRAWRKMLRAAAAGLAPQRDRTVLIEHLTQAYRALLPDLDPTTSPWTSLTLTHRLAQCGNGAAVAPPVAEAIAELRGIQSSIARASWSELTYPGLLRRHVAEFRRARKLFLALREKRDPERIHQWRKHVKAHLYQMRLLVNLAPKALRAEAVEFYQLAELLGEHHDLSNLQHAISLSRATFLPIVELPGLEPWVRTRMQALEQEAMRQGRRLFFEQPKSRRARLRKLLTSLSDTDNVNGSDTHEGLASSIPPRESTRPTSSNDILR